MANNTDEWWDLNGVSLHQYGWSIATVGGSRYDLPPRRGTNITLAQRPGQLHRPKQPDSRVINLVMWLTGADPATGAPMADPVLQWNDSWDFLRRAVWAADGAQVDLTRRWRLTIDDVPTVLAATAAAEISDTMTPTMTGRTRAEFVMTFLLADPYFYGDWINVRLDNQTPVNVANPGQALAQHARMQIILVGPLTRPRLVTTDIRTGAQTWFRFTDTIADGDIITLDIGDYRAYDADGSSQLGKIAYGGSRFWMVLQPGDNPLFLDSDDAGETGWADLAFQPPYI